MAENVEIQGLEELAVKLKKITDIKKMESAIQTACALVERSAKQKAPKGTGELRRSITSKVDVIGNNVVGVVFTPLEYAPYVEYGTGLFAEKGGRQDVPWAYTDEETGELIWTSGQKPSPYMRPALNENKIMINRLIKEALKKDD